MRFLSLSSARTRDFGSLKDIRPSSRAVCRGVTQGRSAWCARVCARVGGDGVTTLSVSGVSLLSSNCEK